MDSWEVSCVSEWDDQGEMDRLLKEENKERELLSLGKTILREQEDIMRSKTRAVEQVIEHYSTILHRARAIQHWDNIPTRLLSSSEQFELGILWSVPEWNDIPLQDCFADQDTSLAECGSSGRQLFQQFAELPLVRVCQWLLLNKQPWRNLWMLLNKSVEGVLKSDTHRLKACLLYSETEYCTIVYENFDIDAIYNTGSFELLYFRSCYCPLHDAWSEKYSKETRKSKLIALLCSSCCLPYLVKIIADYADPSPSVLRCGWKSLC